MSGPASDPDGRAADFASRFAAYWAAPTAEGLGAVLAEEVRLVTPLAPETEGLEQARRSFAQLFAAIPDLRGEVHRWGPTADGVLIEFTLSGSIGGRPISWRAVDRFVLGADGLATERVTYFDSAALAARLAARPRAWGPLARSWLGPRRRR